MTIQTAAASSGMSAGAISVLKERCTSLTNALATKEDDARALHAAMDKMEQQFRSEVSGVYVELDSAKAALRREQADRKILKLEKTELEVSLASLTASSDAKIADAVSKCRTEMKNKEIEFDEELNNCQLALQQAIENSTFKQSSQENKQELRRMKDKLLSQEEEISLLVSQIENLNRAGLGKRVLSEPTSVAPAVSIDVSQNIGSRADFEQMKSKLVQ